jgi:hypothetical protein
MVQAISVSISKGEMDFCAPAGRGDHRRAQHEIDGAAIELTLAQQTYEPTHQYRPAITGPLPATLCYRSRLRVAIELQREHLPHCAPHLLPPSLLISTWHNVVRTLDASQHSLVL